MTVAMGRVLSLGPVSAVASHLVTDPKWATFDGLDHGLALARWDPFDPPVRARLRDRADVLALRVPVGAASTATDHDRVRSVAGGVAQRPDVVGRHVLPRPAVCVPVQARSVPARGAAGGSRIRVAAADPDRNPRLLNGQRPERDLLDPEVPALEAERFPAPESGDDLKALVEQLGACPWISFLPEADKARVCGRERLAGVAQADAEDHPSAGELVDSGCLARDVPRAPARERRDLGAEPDPRGARGDRGEGDPGVARRGRGIALVADVVLEEEAVPPGRLAPLAELGEEARIAALAAGWRSEERRVGKECRSRWSPDHEKKKKKKMILWRAFTDEVWHRHYTLAYRQIW